MALTTAEGLTDWAAGTARAGFRRRNWPVVRRLAAATVTLLLVGLRSEYVAGPPGLATVCWVGAAVAGTAMLVWFFDRRRFVEQTPALRP